MTGWEVARRAKVMRPGMPALLVTGWGDELEPPPGVLVDGIITKPFDVTRLCVAVEEALRRSRRAAAAR
jgi:DNA-binding response OmpR family regulator